MAASVWDGLAGLMVGLVADRRDARAFMRWNAVPLAVAFVAIYLPIGGPWAGLFALVAHMAFRTFYVAVNVPYAALTLRIAPDSISRSRIAGLRMILGGGVAAVLVALATQGSIGMSTAAGHPALAYAVVAVPLAIGATVLLFVVARMRPAAAPDGVEAARPDVRQILAAIVGNPAFLMVNLGICGAVAAMAVLTRAIPYYFKYQVGNEPAGAAALAMMGVAGIVAVPVWMACAARLGHRLQWQLSSALAGLALISLLVIRPGGPHGAQCLFILFQAGGQGLFFGFWALIPDVVEHGGRPGSVRADVFMFGVAALLQKVAQGVAVAIFGLLLSAAGYAARDVQPRDVLDSLVWLTATLPLAAMAIASAAMLRFPNLQRASQA